MKEININTNKNKKGFQKIIKNWIIVKTIAYRPYCDRCKNYKKYIYFVVRF